MADSSERSTDNPKFGIVFSLFSVFGFGVSLMAPTLFWVGALVCYAAAAGTANRYRSDIKQALFLKLPKKVLLEAITIFLMVAAEVCMPSYLIWNRITNNNASVVAAVTSSSTSILSQAAPSDCYVASTASQDMRTKAAIFEGFVKNSTLELAGASCLTIVDRSSISVFEKYFEIWLWNQNRFFLLSNTHNDWDSHQEGEECDYLKDPYCGAGSKKGLEYFQSIFPPGPHQGEYAYYGAAAKYMDQNRKEFDRIGWQKWDCEVPGKIFFQEFSNGYAVGPFVTVSTSSSGRI